jgi:hypothetical protein
MRGGEARRTATKSAQSGTTPLQTANLALMPITFVGAFDQFE